MGQRLGRGAELFVFQAPCTCRVLSYSCFDDDVVRFRTLNCEEVLTQDGFFRMARGRDECHVESLAVAVTVTL